MTTGGPVDDRTLFLVGIYVMATPDGDDDDFETFFDRLWGELARAGEHAHLTGSVDEGRFTVWVEVRAEDPLEADALASAKVRSAALAVGAGTDNWPEGADWPTGMKTEALEVREAIAEAV